MLLPVKTDYLPTEYVKGRLAGEKDGTLSETIMWSCSFQQPCKRLDAGRQRYRILARVTCSQKEGMPPLGFILAGYGIVTIPSPPFLTGKRIEACTVIPRLCLPFGVRHSVKCGFCHQQLAHFVVVGQFINTPVS